MPSQEIGFEKRLRNDPFCVEWDVKPQLTRPDSSLRYRRYINHLLTYLLTYLLTQSISHASRMRLQLQSATDKTRDWRSSTSTSTI